jgi:hypothetical protein
MNMPKTAVPHIKMVLATVLLAALTGCAGGYVAADGGYGGAVIVPDPVVGIYGGGYYGGGYDRGHDVHAYSERGSASRGVAHGGGGARGGGGRR